LELGDRGNQVVSIQKMLVAAGFAVGERGVFDEITEEAVRQFQEAKGLRVDGIVGPQTLAALPALSKSNSKKAGGKSHLWYEDKSAPLTPFIYKQN
jgi:peptidoglycan hydrolase-like protein with peptidoglycan-binding domain